MKSEANLSTGGSSHDSHDGENNAVPIPIHQYIKNCHTLK